MLFKMIVKTRDSLKATAADVLWGPFLAQVLTLCKHSAF